MVIDCRHSEIASLGITEAIIQSQMMAPKASGDTVLGRHHPPVAPPHEGWANSYDEAENSRGYETHRQDPFVHDGKVRHMCWPSN